MGSLPLIHLVPEDTLEGTDKVEKNHVKIMIFEHTTKSFKISVNSGPVSAIMLICLTSLLCRTKNFVKSIKPCLCWSTQNIHRKFAQYPTY